uniref:Putative LOC100368669 [Saccoglossus kowalevskii] n=1 Tax=Lepeophtheirus salmonis TaxID=72036 RepID=A0A0K2V8Z1_LEPSM
MKVKERIICVRKLDDSFLPLCSISLLQNIRRIHLVARRWLTATRSTQVGLFPQVCGWKNVNGCYQFVWFEGDSPPKIIAY